MMEKIYAMTSLLGLTLNSKFDTTFIKENITLISNDEAFKDEALQRNILFVNSEKNFILHETPFSSSNYQCFPL